MNHKAISLLPLDQLMRCLFAIAKREILWAIDLRWHSLLDSVVANQSRSNYSNRKPASGGVAGPPWIAP